MPSSCTRRFHHSRRHKREPEEESTTDIAKLDGDPSCNSDKLRAIMESVSCYTLSIITSISHSTSHHIKFESLLNLFIIWKFIRSKPLTVSLSFLKENRKGKEESDARRINRIDKLPKLTRPYLTKSAHFDGD